MLSNNIIDKILGLKDLSFDEILHLYNNVSFSELAFYANKVRRRIHNNNSVSYIIDRNINYTNICYSACKFCKFCSQHSGQPPFLLRFEDFRPKIEELYSLGGRQILLQGGLAPNLGIDYYTDLFSSLKKAYPDIKIHALSPPEIVHIANKEKSDYKKILTELKKSGLDSLPGGGAEILSDRVRKIISPNKCDVAEWLAVMETAHKHSITTSATMMFGHLETVEERIRHLLLLRDLQSKKPEGSKGFISFTLWPIVANPVDKNDIFFGIQKPSEREYLKMMALSRLVLNNIPNMQASWLTMGSDIAGVALFSGANDLSSIMIEENVLSAAGNKIKMGEKEIIKLIKSLGFKPVKRNQEYDVS